MSTASNFVKKVLDQPDLALIVFRIAVLDRYLQGGEARVTRTETVGRVKLPAWAVDFGIAPDEQTIHVPIATLKQRLPESERPHWLEYVESSRFSENFLKMLSSHACIDDGGFRVWGEAPLF